MKKEIGFSCLRINQLVRIVLHNEFNLTLYQNISKVYLTFIIAFDAVYSDNGGRYCTISWFLENQDGIFITMNLLSIQISPQVRTSLPFETSFCAWRVVLSFEKYWLFLASPISQQPANISNGKIDRIPIESHQGLWFHLQRNIDRDKSICK